MSGAALPLCVATSGDPKQNVSQRAIWKNAPGSPAMSVYPQTGDRIDALGVGQAWTTTDANGICDFTTTATGQWNSTRIS